MRRTTVLGLPLQSGFPGQTFTEDKTVKNKRIFGQNKQQSECIKTVSKHLFKCDRGARKLTGENLKLVWAEFSTLSQAVLVMSIFIFKCMNAHNYS